MASEQTAMNVIGNALWNPTPTKTDLAARQLAFVLGYPVGWRVVRTIEEMYYPPQLTSTATSSGTDTIVAPALQPEVVESEQTAANNATQESNECITLDSNVKNVNDEEPSIDAAKVHISDVVISQSVHDESNDKEIAVVDGRSDLFKNEQINLLSTELNDNTKTDQNEVKADAHVENIKSDPDNTKIEQNEVENSVRQKSDSVGDGDSKCIATENDSSKPKLIKVIVDRIYAGDPQSGCDMWYNHESAMQVSDTWHQNLEGTTNENDDDDVSAKTTRNSPFGQRGGHLLPRLPLYEKGDKVQVFYENDWFDAKIVKRNESRTQGFLYQVYYSTDNSKQSKVLEKFIRPRKHEKDPAILAAEIGFTNPGWKAYLIGANNKYKIIAPDGTVYKSKKAALDSYNQDIQRVKDEGDPPWRTTGNPYIGRRILWTHTHQASARRVVSIDQIGEITGYISETDTDAAGQPGFVSEHTNKPARLYHVKFKDDPRHPYTTYLLTEQDLEEHEVIENLIEEKVGGKKEDTDKKAESSTSKKRDFSSSESSSNVKNKKRRTR